MTIRLTNADIDEALPNVERGLKKYLNVQRLFGESSFRADPAFRQAFNGFYRVRRGAAWQDAFYGILVRAKAGPSTFAAVLAELHRATGRCEASFASKLLATVDPSVPVIDSVVLKNLGLRLPSYGIRDRERKMVDLHESMSLTYREHLATEAGRDLVARFRARFPKADVTETKMLDLVLWQHNRKARPS